MLQKQTPLHVPLDNSVARPYVNTRFRPQATWSKNVRQIFTSRVSGRGNILGSVRPSVCLFPLCRPNRWTYRPKIWHIKDIKDHHISDKFEGQGHRSRSPRSRMSELQFSAQFQKRWSKVKVTWVKVKVTKVKGRRSRSKVVGQGHRVKVKVVWGVLYPIDSREVRHAGVFIERWSSNRIIEGNVQGGSVFGSLSTLMKL